jgi:hypothetical protein
MDARLSRILIGLGAVAVLGVGGVVVNGVIETTRALAGNGKPRAEAKATVAEPDPDPKPAPPPMPEPERPRREVDPNAHIAPDPNAPRPENDAPGGGGAGPARSVAERAEDRGLTPHELRERLAAKQGLTLDQYQRRRDARSEWRGEQDPEDLPARKSSRDQRHQELSKEEIDALEAARSARKELAEADPALKDAVQVLKQLQEVGGEAPR